MEPHIIEGGLYTCDSLSKEAVPVYHQIVQLSELSDPEAIKLAWLTSFKAIGYTIAGMGQNDYTSGRGEEDDRPSDPLFDDLLCDLMHKLCAQNGPKDTG